MNDSQRLAKIVEKIHLFRDLEIKEIESLLRICTYRSFEVGEQIYKRNDPSTEMLILLSGRLSVRSEAGDALAHIEPGAPVGEMGVFTGETRSAGIIAMEPSNALTIDKANLYQVLEANKAMHFKVLQNLIHVLSRRLADANEANAEHAETIIRLQDLLVRYTGKTAGDLE
ncbi:MAG: cyclic nucleotide-binding domain-containing protein [Candidatus Latescibacterota bacterium]|nr:cyclic nucleotide-binding domain-containing protein [Candidatus Latescibacterota bacterium]